MDNNSVVPSLKNKREHMGFQQEDLAGLVGVSTTTICRWELGKQAPSIEKLNKLAEVLECTIQDLLNPPRPSKGEIYRQQRLARAKEQKQEQLW